MPRDPKKFIMYIATITLPSIVALLNVAAAAARCLPSERKETGSVIEAESIDVKC